MHSLDTLTNTLFVRRWHCEYGPEDHSHMVKDITFDLLPKAQRKNSIVIITASINNVLPGNIPTRKGRPSRKKKAPREFKAKAIVKSQCRTFY